MVVTVTPFAVEISEMRLPLAGPGRGMSNREPGVIEKAVFGVVQHCFIDLVELA